MVIDSSRAEITKPGMQDKFTRFCSLKLLVVEYLAAMGESSSLWGAIEEINGLIDYLDLCRALNIEGEGSGENLAWIEQSICGARKIGAEIITRLQGLLEDPTKLDPTLKKCIKEIDWLLDFYSCLNTIAIAERKECFFDLAPEFERVRIGMSAPSLDHLLKKAHQEMASRYGVPSNELTKMLPLLSFSHRPTLQDLGIFRIRQELRHLVYSAAPVPAGMIEQVYCTPGLDEYLMCRDLLTSLLCKWGRFIPLEYNHYLIKFYNEPRYWENQHCFLGDIDQLHLGLAYYRYAMEMGNNNKITRMIYRQALDCFRKTAVFLPETLSERLWGN